MTKTGKERGKQPGQSGSPLSKHRGFWRKGADSAGRETTPVTIREDFPKRKDTSFETEEAEHPPWWEKAHRNEIP